MESSKINKRTVLAISSGKGGSGKTSLALSLAQVLSKSKIKVALLDCDFITHGCTYFFENALEYSPKQVTSLLDAISSETAMSDSILGMEINALDVSDYFKFLPSVMNAREGRIKRRRSYTYKLLDEYFTTNEIQMVILDCQAGYSEETEFFLKHASVILMVLEADLISASALRVLYFKLADIINTTKSFQVFNKVTTEEFERYSQFSGNTLLPNLSPILFDWSVRDAFAINSIPEITSDNFSYSYYIFDLATALLPQYKRHVNQFILSTKMEYLNLLKERDEIAASARKKDRTKYILRRILYFVLPFISILSIVLLIIDVTTTSKQTYLTSLMLTLLTSFSMISIWMLTRDRKHERRNNDNRFLIQTLQEETTLIQKKLDDNSIL